MGGGNIGLPKFDTKSGQARGRCSNKKSRRKEPGTWERKNNNLKGVLKVKRNEGNAA